MDIRSCVEKMGSCILRPATDENAHQVRQPSAILPGLRSVVSYRIADQPFFPHNQAQVARSEPPLPRRRFAYTLQQEQASGQS